MTESKSTTQKLVYFALGAGLPIAAYLLWTKTDLFPSFNSRKKHIDEQHDITVEDSFPASDPPSAW